MSIETQYQNGSDTRYDVDQMQKALLKRLEQQNRILEEDKNSCTRIMSHSGSNASITEDSTSIHSVESTSSPFSPPPGQPIQDDQTTTAAAEVSSVSSVDQSSNNKIVNHSTSPPRLPELTQHEDSLSPVPSVESPTEVKSKPLPYCPSTDNLYEEDPGDYEHCNRDKGLGGSELGPDVSIVMDDGYGTTIDYNEVVPQGDDRESVGGYELHEEEAPQRNAHDKFTPQTSQDSLHLLTQQESKMEAGYEYPKTLSPVEETETRSLSPAVVVSDQNSNPSTDVVSGGGEEDKHSKENEERLLQSEEKDTVPDLVSTVSSKGTPPLPWKRQRSETDLHVGTKVSLASLVGRRRTLSTVESKLAEEEKLEEKSEEQLEEDLWLQWSNLLKNWEENAKKNLKLVKQLAKQGIPEHLRGMAWQLLSDSYNLELKEQYPSLITEVSPFARAIQRDLARTFPEHSFFKEKDGLGQESLFNVLKAYSIYDREVGYCQGSPFITGLLLMQMPEEDAFCVFVSLMKNYKLRELFKPSMADLGLCFYQLEKLVEELFPSLYIHFKAVGFQTSMYASPWFLTMFASVLSMNVAYRVMDVFMVEGREVIFRVGLALLEYSMDRLVQLDMEDMLKHFQKEMKQIHEGDPNPLMQRAFRIKYNAKKLKKLEKEYMYRKEKQANENKEVIRLQNENDELTQRLILLERECASLADRLIQGQVTRAQEAEEMFVVKKELSKMRRRVSELELQTDGKPVSPSTPVGVEGHSPNEQQDEAVNSGLQQQEDQTADHPTGKDKKESKKNKKRHKSQTSQSSDGEKEKEFKKEKHKKEVQRTRSSSMEPESPVSLPNSPVPKLSKKEKKRKKAELIGELALAKTQCADVSNQLEHKSLELKHALQRESFVIRELRSAREYVTSLEQKLSEVKMERMSCPECRLKLGQPQRSDSESSTSSSLANSVSPAHPQSSDVLLSQLRALWNSKPSTVDELDSPAALSDT